MTDINRSEECPICFSKEVMIGKYCHGCDHEFCFKCISSWVTDHNARCPLCNGDVYGIHSQDSSIYLTPHYDNFGIVIKENGKYTELNQVIERGIAEQYNLKIGNVIMINNKSSYLECSKELEIAHTKKRMIKIDIISSQTLTPTPTHTTPIKSNNCLNFLKRVCRISP